MTPYSNNGGDSGVRAFSYGSGFINVMFSDGSLYTYTNASAGSNHIQNMIRLAQSGHGLNSYIMKNVRMGYTQRSR